MKPFLHELLSLAKLRSGRRMSLYRQWQPILTNHGLTAILAYVDRAMAHDGATRELENRWKASTSRRRYSTDMPTIDALVDGMLYALFRLTRAQINGLPANDPLVARATDLEHQLFPAGVSAIARLPYNDQAIAVEGIR